MLFLCVLICTILFPTFWGIMIDNILIKTLKTFSVKEMKEFREFIISPFYNTNPNVVSLFDLLKKYFPAFKSKSLEKEKIFSKIYEEEKFKDSKLRLLFFYLNELSEKFLVHKNITEDPLAHDVRLLNELAKRNLNNNFEKTINGVYKKLKITKVKDTNYFINKFHIDNYHLNYFSQFPRYSYIEKNNAVIPGEIFSGLTDFYRLSAFKLYEILQTSNYLYDRSFNLDAFEKIISEFNKNDYKEYPEILCRYYLCMLWYKAGDEDNYNQLKKLLEKNADKISYEAVSASFIGLQNFYVKNIRMGEKKFLRELLELHKNALDNKMYLEDGYMTHTFYRNTVSAGAGLKEFEWTRNFIEEHKNKLQKEIKDAVYFYSLAYLETEQGNYEKAIKNLSVIKTDEIYLKVAVRILQCRLFFELGWHEQLSSLVDSSRHFMANDKILPALQKNFYLGFFKFTHKLMLAKASVNVHRLEILKKEIEKENNLHAKKWLLMKLEEFLNKKGA